MRQISRLVNRFSSWDTGFYSRDASTILHALKFVFVLLLLDLVVVLSCGKPTKHMTFFTVSIRCGHYIASSRVNGTWVEVALYLYIGEITQFQFNPVDSGFCCSRKFKDNGNPIGHNMIGKRHLGVRFKRLKTTETMCEYMRRRSVLYYLNILNGEKSNTSLYTREYSDGRLGF